MTQVPDAPLQYPFGDALPALGHTLEVAPGVRWLRMPLPFALDHINLWLLRDELDGRAGWTIVDCGVHDTATRDAWERIFANELDGLPVLRVIVTHMHPDHIGAAHWLTERWQCRLWISATDYHVARGATPAGGRDGERARAFLAAHGLADRRALNAAAERGSFFESLVPALPDAYTRLLDRQRLSIGGREWFTIAGYGHAPEHMALHCPALNAFIAGDMVLPRISTNVSVFENEPEGDPLRQYLDSIEQMKRLPADLLVLPSHGLPFVGLHARIAQLQQHHADRLAEVQTACAEAPACAADLLQLLFKRQLGAHQLVFAMGESIAHLHALWLTGQLRRARGEDGVYRFAPAA